LQFEVEIGEKAWSTPVDTVHQRHEKQELGEQFMQNLLRKTT
jgi:hypothetical protein